MAEKKATPKKKPIAKTRAKGKKKSVKSKVKKKVSNRGEKKEKAKGGVLIPKTATDWLKLKKQFFISNNAKVLSFLKANKIVDPEKKKGSGYISKMTKGWAKEKREAYQEQIDDIRTNFREQAEEYVREIFVPLKEAKQMTLNAILERLGTHRDMGPFGPFLKLGDLIQILHTIKTELGEPSSISSSNTTHAHIDINKLLEYAESSDEPVDPKSFDKAVYGDDVFDGGPEIVIDGRVQT